jgi:hypothetical protein
MGMHGGLSIWLLRNTGKILGWADSARDDWGIKPLDLRNNLISILNDLVGTPFALLGPDTSDTLNQGPTDYLRAIAGNLNAIAVAPGTTPKEHLLTAQINMELTNVRYWLVKVHQDATQLVSMTEAQLHSQQSLYILNDMVKQAFYAYAGQVDLSTNSVQGGVTQINYDIAQLAAFDIKPFKKI